MKNTIILIMSLAIFMACGHQQRADGSEGSTASAPGPETSRGASENADTTVDPSSGTNQAAAASRPSAALKAILDSNMIRMGRLELTNHPVKDFALLMRVHHAGVRQLIASAMKNELDHDLNAIARQVERSLRQEVVDLNRFIIDSRFQKQQKENAVSNNLMRSMTPNNESQMPLSGNVSDDFAMLLITSLQSANDMVKVMDDGNAGYEISGFSEPMVQRNQKYIDTLKKWREEH